MIIFYLSKIEIALQFINYKSFLRYKIIKLAQFKGFKVRVVTKKRKKKKVRITYNWKKNKKRENKKLFCKRSRSRFKNKNNRIYSLQNYREITNIAVFF